MKPVAFRYERPESVEEAVALLAEHGDEAKVLAGGQSLVPMLNMRLARPSVLVDVNRLPLGEVARDNGSWRVGAIVRQADPRLLEIPLLARVPAVRRPLRHAQPRHRRRLDRPRGRRRRAAARAHRPRRLGRDERGPDDPGRGVLRHALHDGARARRARSSRRSGRPTAPDTRYAFEEFALRHGDFALCMAAAVAGAGRAARRRSARSSTGRR